ncbi:MAG: OsmC family protein [Pseudorhodobacter sp.]
MHGARVIWKASGDFASGRYSRAHHWAFDGGAVVPASASPSVVPLPWSDAAGVDPEEAYVAALSSCHMLWFLDLARRAGLVAVAYEDDATGEMRTEAGRAWVARVTLRPRVTWGIAPDAPTETALHHAAHDQCFIANSVRTEIVIAPAEKDRT